MIQVWKFQASIILLGKMILQWHRSHCEDFPDNLPCLDLHRIAFPILCVHIGYERPVCACVHLSATFKKDLLVDFKSWNLQKGQPLLSVYLSQNKDRGSCVEKKAEGLWEGWGEQQQVTAGLEIPLH